MFFEKFPFPVTDKLVCDGVTFEGFAPVIQGEISGSYQDENCTSM